MSSHVLLNQPSDLKPVVGGFAYVAAADAITATAIDGGVFAAGYLASVDQTRMRVYIVFEASVRYRSDGTAPTTSVGIPIDITGTGAFGILISLADALAMQFIAQSDTVQASAQLYSF